MSDFVSAAPPSGGISWSDIKGSLVIIEPLSVETDIQTAYGATDAVRANVYVLTGPDSADVHEDSLIFPKLLQGQLRSQINKKVVGRLGSGVAKPGQSAPHILEPATEDDIAKAKTWLESRATPALTSAPPAGQASAAPPF